MRYLIVSDIHGAIEQLPQIEKFAVADINICLGDTEVADDHPSLANFICVKGNNDYFSKFPLQTKFELDNFNFLLVHGHYQSVYFDRTALSYEMSEVGANIGLYGHTHTPNVEIIGDHLLICPGSTSMPRRYKKPTFVIMTIDGDDIYINFYDAITFDKEKELSKKVLFYLHGYKSFQIQCNQQQSKQLPVQTPIKNT